MSTLLEIEKAADSLPPEEKRELLMFLASRLRGHGMPQPPQPRGYSEAQISKWIAQDEEEFRRFQAGP